MKVCVKKTCKHGGKYQKSDQFYPNKESRDGLDCYCKTCRKEAANKIHAKKRNTKWYSLIIG